MILDSDIVIDVLRRRPAAVQRIATLPEPPVISGIAALEVVFGARDGAELSRVKRFLEDFPIAWPNADDAERAHSLAGLRLSHGIGLLDALAAALALRLNVPVATFNVKHFEAVPGVVTIQPYLVLPCESRLIGWQTRQLLYSRTRESVAYHAFYTIDERH